MKYGLLNNTMLCGLLAIIMLPVAIIIWLAFYYVQGAGSAFSLAGFMELFTSSRLHEIREIFTRALIVSLCATTMAFLLCNLLVFHTSSRFQTVFFIVVIFPFLINEAIRIFSWRYILSESGFLNQLLSALWRRDIIVFSASNSANIYVTMVLACLPFAVFICAASLKLVPSIYWKVSGDLKLSSLSRFLKVTLPLNKVPILAAFTVTFFLAFSLSSEVNLLGGDTKLSIRNLTLSLMSASKFQAIFSLGFLIIFVLLTIIGVYLFISKYLKR